MAEGTDSAAQACTEVHAPGFSRAHLQGVAAGSVLLAAVVAVDPAGWYPFGPSKQGAVFVAALAAVILACGQPGRLPRAVVALWGGLLAWLGVAAAVGADRFYAWVGTPERRFGWLTWALLAVCMWAGARVGGGVRWLCRTTVMAGLWCGGYCLVELWWRAPVATTSVTSRLGGPFGSAAYLGAALCLLVPVAVAVAADMSEPRGWRLAAGLAATSGAIGLIGSGTRAAWVAVATVGLLAVCLRRPSPRYLVAVAAVLIVAGAAVAPRFVDVVQRDGGGGTSRLAEWDVAARVIARHPVLGSGPEGYRIAFAEAVDADYEREYGRASLPDRAHSTVLDVAAIGGVPAALLHLGLLGIVGWRALTALRRGAALLAGLGTAALAYLLQQLALFPLAELDPAFWLVAGVLASRPVQSVTVGHLNTEQVVARTGSDRGWPTLPTSRDASGSDPSLVRIPAPAHPRGAKALALVLVGVVFVVSVVGVAADRVARDALAYPPGSAEAIAAAARAADLRPDVLRYHLLEATLAAERQSVAGARAAVAAAQRATDVSPRDPIARQARARARTALAHVTGDPGDRAAAVADWHALVSDDPNCGPCWLGLGTARLLAGDAVAAEQAYAQAAALGQARP